MIYDKDINEILNNRYIRYRSEAMLNAQLNVERGEITLSKNSDDGEYEAIEVEITEGTTEVTISTVSGSARVMINAIEFIY